MSSSTWVTMSATMFISKWSEDTWLAVLRNASLKSGPEGPLDFNLDVMNTAKVTCYFLIYFLRTFMVHYGSVILARC